MKAPRFSKMHSGDLCLVLEEGVDYDSFPAVAERWAKKLGLSLARKVDGPCEHLWECERSGKTFRLAYDDWFPEISLEPCDAEAAREIPSIGAALGAKEQNA
jgi:hypothetical protein